MNKAANSLSCMPRGARTIFPLLLSVLIVLISVVPVRAQGCVPLPPYATDADRIGVNVITDYGKSFWDYDTDTLGAGWFIDYGPNPYLGSRPYLSTTVSATGTSDVASTDDSVAILDSMNDDDALLLAQDEESAVSVTAMAYAPVVRVADLDGGRSLAIHNLVQANPGMLWIIGNEPDRHMQDAIHPEEYAVKYHAAYKQIKEQDPTAQVAIAAVVEPTPLRRRYYDAVLNEYRRLYGHQMPVDVWNVHAFILRESNEWGAGIPTGVEEYADEGHLYDVPDHGNVEILKGLIRDFRKWMADRGYQNTPLIISEYGILLAPDYDAGNGRVYDYDTIGDYMRRSFDFFRTARNKATGYPADDYRLVQAWSWFGLNNYVYSYPDRQDGFNGNLFDHDSAAITPLGQAFSDYTTSLSLKYVDLAFRRIDVSHTQLPAQVQDKTVNVSLSIYNRGNVRINDSRIRFWLDSVEGGRQLLKEVKTPVVMSERCREVFDAYVTLPLPPLKEGYYSLIVEVSSANGEVEDPLPENGRKIIQLVVGDAIEWPLYYIPAISK